MNSTKKTLQGLQRNAAYRLEQQAVRDRERTATLLQPTLPERINRLNPAERHEVTRLIRSMKLRKIIKRILAEAYHQPRDVTSMQRLRSAVRTHESLMSYDRSLIPSVDSITLEAVK